MTAEELTIYAFLFLWAVAALTVTAIIFAIVATALTWRDR